MMGLPLFMVVPTVPLSLSAVIDLWVAAVLFVFRSIVPSTSSVSPSTHVSETSPAAPEVDLMKTSLSPDNPIVSAKIPDEPAPLVEQHKPAVLVRVASFKLRVALCDNCGESASGIKCVFCKTTCYCSTTCRIAGFMFHRRSCIILVGSNPEIESECLPAGYKPTNSKGPSIKLTKEQIRSRRFALNDPVLCEMMESILKDHGNRNLHYAEALWAESKLRFPEGVSIEQEDLSEIPKLTHTAKTEKMTRDLYNARWFMMSDDRMMAELKVYLQGQTGGNLHLVEGEFAIRKIRERLKANGIKSW